MAEHQNIFSKSSRLIGKQEKLIVVYMSIIRLKAEPWSLSYREKKLPVVITVLVHQGGLMYIVQALHPCCLWAKQESCNLEDQVMSKWVGNSSISSEVLLAWSADEAPSKSNSATGESVAPLGIWSYYTLLASHFILALSKAKNHHVLQQGQNRDPC